jgi:hypothetical protein
MDISTYEESNRPLYGLYTVDKVVTVLLSYHAIHNVSSLISAYKEFHSVVKVDSFKTAKVRSN